MEPEDLIYHFSFRYKKISPSQTLLVYILVRNTMQNIAYWPLTKFDVIAGHICVNWKAVIHRYKQFTWDEPEIRRHYEIIYIHRYPQSNGQSQFCVQIRSVMESGTWALPSGLRQSNRQSAVLSHGVLGWPRWWPVEGVRQTTKKRICVA